MNISNRKGRISLSFDVIRNILTDSIPIQSIFKNFIIVSAEARYMDNYIDYEAYSELFDEIAEGQVTPTYELVIGVDEATKTLKILSVTRTELRTASLESLRV